MKWAVNSSQGGAVYSRVPRIVQQPPGRAVMRVWRVIRDLCVIRDLRVIRAPHLP